MYDPFGDVTGTSGTVDPTIGFQSDYTDPTSEHVWMGARWYDGGRAAFLSRDTVFGELSTPISVNRYTYGSNNPLAYWDPDGRISQQIINDEISASDQNTKVAAQKANTARMIALNTEPATASEEQASADSMNAAVAGREPPQCPVSATGSAVSAAYSNAPCRLWTGIRDRFFGGDEYVARFALGVAESINSVGSIFTNPVGAVAGLAGGAKTSFRSGGLRGLAKNLVVDPTISPFSTMGGCLRDLANPLSIGRSDPRTCGNAAGDLAVMGAFAVSVQAARAGQIGATTTRRAATAVAPDLGAPPNGVRFLDDASAPIGRRGGQIEIGPGTNQPATIGGQQYTGHALDRMQGRGIMPSAVDDAIRNSQAVRGTDGSMIQYSSTNNISVVLNGDGSVRTVSYGAFKPR